MTGIHPELGKKPVDGGGSDFGPGELQPSAHLHRSFPKWLGSPSAGGLFLLASALAVLFCCAVTLKIGLPHIATYGQDMFIMLDGGWRIFNGQRPATDFYSAFGPVSYLLTAAGFALSAQAPLGLVYATALTGLLIGCWTVLVVWRALPIWAGLLSVTYLVLLCLAPFPIGEAFYLTSYAMQYNRLGYALLSLIILEQFGTARSDIRGLSTGVAAAILLFLKINFFVVAVILIATAYTITSGKKKHLTYLMLGFSLVAVCMFWYLRWDSVSMIRDITTAALARRGRIRGMGEPVRILLRNVTEIAALAGAGYVVVQSQLVNRSWAKVQGAWGTAGVWNIVSFLVAIFLADFLLALSNTQRYGFPLTLIGILVMSAQLSIRSPEPGRIAAGLRQAALPILAVVMLLPPMVATVNSWSIIWAERLRPPESPLAFVATPILSGLLFDDHADPTGLDHEANNGQPYISFINEGLDLITRNSGAADRIACLCFSNPFSYALLRKPPAGGSPFFEYTTNFTETYAPSARRILGDAEIVMYPKGRSEFSRLNILLNLCEPELSAHYRKAAESENWILFHRIASSYPANIQP